MKITIPLSELKSRGYIFQKLYARNHKTYRKKFKSGWTIWIWVANKGVEINDYYEHTEPIINYWKNNVDRFRDKYKGTTSVTGGERCGMFLELNRTTGEIRERNYLKYLEESCDDSYPFTELILTTDSFEEIVNEIDYLTK